jgi:hypothetical protein
MRNARSFALVLRRAAGGAILLAAVFLTAGAQPPDASFDSPATCWSKSQRNRMPT